LACSSAAARSSAPPSPGAPPAVYGEWNTAGATRTVVLYAHYDGQPTDPKKWTGTQPWEPQLRTAPFEKGGAILPTPAEGESINPEWRLYARSASDDKAGVMSILTAFDALRAKNIAPTVNLKFFFEGEEEAGSPHLVEILSKNKELLASDAWVVCDGPVHQSGRKQVVFGVRGDVNVEVTVYGPARPLHSGHYGNWAPNPAMTLARLLASMKTDAGRVTIKGWYDDVVPLGEAERRALSEAPAYDEELKKELGINRPEGAGRSLLELIKTRVSQINGCAYCIDMHTKDARAAGETEQRLYMLEAWRESPFYTERERAALAWAEAVTLVREGHVPDEVYEQARAQFGEDELANLTLAVVAINGWNRFNIAFRTEPGGYKPGMFAAA